MKTRITIAGLALSCIVAMGQAQSREESGRSSHSGRVQGLLSRIKGHTPSGPSSSSPTFSHGPVVVRGESIEGPATGPGMGMPTTRIVSPDGPVLRMPEGMPTGNPEVGTVRRVIPRGSESGQQLSRSLSTPKPPARIVHTPSSPRSFTPSTYGSPDGVVPPGYVTQPMTAREFRADFGSAHEKLTSAISKKNTTEVDASLNIVRDRAEQMRGRLQNLPPQKKFQVGSISRIYDMGADLIEEGRRNGEESKLRLGLEKIEQGNRQLEQLEAAPQ